MKKQSKQLSILPQGIQDLLLKLEYPSPFADHEKMQKQIIGEGYILVTTVTITVLYFLISSNRNLSEFLCQLLSLFFCLRSRTHRCHASIAISEYTNLKCGCLLPALFCHPQPSQLLLFTSHFPLLNSLITLKISWSSTQRHYL